MKTDTIMNTDKTPDTAGSTWIRYPEEQGVYWWWSGDPDNAPHILEVLTNGAGDFWVALADDPLTRDVRSDRWRGWWCHVPMPETPIEGKIPS